MLSDGDRRVRQVFEDPDGDDDWGLELAVDEAASNEEGRAILVPTGIVRL